MNKAYSHKFYIGSNDKDEHKQLTGNRDIQECIRSTCGLFFDSYTMFRGIGYFEGELENTYTIEVISDSKTIEATEFITIIKYILNQACVMYTRQSINVELL